MTPEDSHKRPHDEISGQDDANESDSSSDMGPQLPSEAPPKKRRVLPYERLYVAELPRSTRYSKSLMHKDQVAYAVFTPLTEFLITASFDGVVKFWKKMATGIEFVKQYKAHAGEIRGVSVSRDGRDFATVGLDQTAKVFDVVSFDMVAMVALDFVPGSVCWVHKRGASLPLLAVAGQDKGRIDIFDGRGEPEGASQTCIHTITGLHRAPVSLMAFNDAYDCVVSLDETGMIEYWRPSGTYDKPDNVFQYKSSTSLFEMRKTKSTPTSLSISPAGDRFATFSLPDRKLRIFDFCSGRLYRTYDESLQVNEDMQQSGSATHRLEPADFAKRLAVEKELEASPAMRNKPNAIFDETGHFIIYGSMLGVKVLNTYTNQVVRVYGKDEPFRPVNLAIYQGQPQKKGFTTVEMGASDNPLLQESESHDPMLVATGLSKTRFYMYTNDQDFAKSTRDVQNEKPTQLGQKKAAPAKQAETGTAAVMHTTYGDIHLRLFPDAAPRAVENFVTHAKRGYYNNTIFHRVIRKFMIQCGDPLGDGTGGESIWGREFEDEFGTLRHDKPYTLSMANAGPNTNGSQFFITTDKTVSFSFFCVVRGGRLMGVVCGSRGWMGSIRFLGGRRRGWMLCTRLRMRGRTRRSPRRISRF